MPSGCNITSARSRVLGLCRKGFVAIKALDSPVNGLVEGAKCADLETIVVGDDPEKFFQIRA